MKIDFKKLDLSEKKFMNLPFEIKEFRKDDKYFYFEGYLSTFDNVDRGGDIIQKGAFIESLKEHDPSLFWAHDSSEPLGIFEKVFEDEIGLYVHGKMPLADKFISERIIPQMEIGSIKSMSIGYSIWNKDGDPGAVWDKDIRYIRRVYLWEGSLVTIPMNPKAQLKSFNIADLFELDPRTMEKNFHSGLPLSKEASELIVTGNSNK